MKNNNEKKIFLFLSIFVMLATNTIYFIVFANKIKHYPVNFNLINLNYIMILLLSGFWAGLHYKSKLKSHFVVYQTLLWPFLVYILLLLATFILTPILKIKTMFIVYLLLLAFFVFVETMVIFVIYLVTRNNKKK